MSERAVEQRIYLQRRLYDLPSLRRALREGRLSYEKAHLVAAHGTDREIDADIAAAESMTCIELKRYYQALEERQMCTRGELDLRVPERVRILVAAAFGAARKASDRWLAPGECLQTIAQHFIDTWGAALRERSTLRNEVMARDGASVWFRSAANRRRMRITSPTVRTEARTIRRTSRPSVPCTTSAACTEDGSARRGRRLTSCAGRS